MPQPQDEKQQYRRMLEKMLRLLGRQSDPLDEIHIRSIDPAKKEPAKLLTLANFDRIYSLSQNKFNTYLVPNRGGNKDWQITECTCLFIEYDDGDKEQQITKWQELGLPRPTFQLDTGGKSIHHYWTLQEPISPNHWRQLQQRLLNHATGSDQLLKNPSRLMTVAGANKYSSETYVKKGLAETAGQMMGKSTIINDTGVKYAAAELESFLPALSTRPVKSFLPDDFIQQQHQDKNQEISRAQEALSYLPCQDFTEYGPWIEVGMALHSVDPGLLNDWVEWSREMDNFDENECLRKWQTFEKKPDEITIGTLIRSAKRYGYKPTHTPQSIDINTPTWTHYLDEILNAIHTADEDNEMRLRSEVYSDLRVTEARLNRALLKRFSASKITKVKQTHNSIRLGDVAMLDYLMDGWIVKGDVQLLYAPAGVGKTTLALRKCLALARGENLLDRNKPCTPGKSLFIATDSGAAALKKAAFDLGIDVNTDPFINPGPDQMIWIWAHEPSQGHESWACNINGVLKLEQFIKEQNIQYVVIDSAKSVSSVADWNYTDNVDVKIMLTYLRECICAPTGACIEFISHDGSKEGAHSGAKAWSEDPSMVCSLTHALDDTGRQIGVKAQFLKDRAAQVDPRRSVTYRLDEDENDLKAVEGTTVVGSCSEAVLSVLSDLYKKGTTEVKTGQIIGACFERYGRNEKTVRNTLGNLIKGNQAPVIRPGNKRGRYALSPAEIQRRFSEPGCVRPPHPPRSGYCSTKSITTTTISQYPDQCPDAKNGIFRDIPPISRDKGSGHCQTPVTPMDLTPQYPDGHGGGCKTQPETCGKLSDPEKSPIKGPPELVDLHEGELSNRDLDAQIWSRQEKS